jgi:preprotein translocase subunit SecG
MLQVLTVIHVLVALSIIGMVLLQQGRGADAGAGFGGGASNTVFGARGSASFLTRTTAILAAAFFSSSLLLAYFGDKTDNKKDDIMEVVAPAQQGPSDLPQAPAPSDLPAPKPAAPDKQ